MKKLTENKDIQVQIIKKLIFDGSTIVSEIQKLLTKIKEKNQSHPDVITGIKPTLSFICFTNILCDSKFIDHFLPFLDPAAQIGLTQIIKIWVQLKTRLASFQRMKALLESQTLDAIALMREAESPRDQVRKKHHWLCFQAQNKVQLWSSQLDTYNNLTRSGDFCQLNMGQGKTQVIIPMMILDSIYEKKNCLPRINLLSSLIDQARGNFFRFLSVTSFQIPGFEIPFTREVKLWDDIKKDKNILDAQNLVNSFSKRLYILMTRQSRLSEILRFYQINKQKKQVSIQKTPLIPENIKIFDIFDEIDQLMNPIKSYIFSIGTTVDLPHSKERFEILRVLIEVFLKNHLATLLKKNMVISEQTYEQTLQFVKKGNYPPGLRLNIQTQKSQYKTKFKRILAKDLILSLKSTYFSFFKRLNQQQKKYILDYITNPLDKDLEFPDYVEQTWRTQILVLRGALGYGIFEHCLSMRCGVNYGVPNNEHKKRIAVPYDAADIPSKTSEYQHPDVSIILSYLAYYTKGLTYEHFIQAIKKLLTLSTTSKTIEYQSWFDGLSDQDKDEITIKNAQQINYNSKVVINQLYHFYRSNRKTIAFWLKVCIFPSNLRQYNQSISASAWDLADVKNSVGFSGTKDNHWLYSDKLNWKPCKTPSISGTDGKMIHLITKNTVKICLIQQNDNNQWQRFVNEALQQKVDCIIDAGALCVGKSLEREIVPWISEHELFNRDKFAGISFCDENGKWKVYDVESKYYIARGTSIPDHETFVIFDEARTRGADLKMNSDVVAAISLGPDMTKDKFMQAAGRLRKLGRKQKLIIMATHEIFSSLPEFSKQKNIQAKIKKISIEDLSNEIIAWCCNNSIQLNEKLLIQYANLGWDYIRSKEDKQIFIKGIRYQKDEQNPENLSDLKRMYEHGIEKTTVAKLNERIIHSLEKKYIDTNSGRHIKKVLNTYGQNVIRQAGTLDDVCQREVQPEPDVQKQQEDGVSDLNPINQVDNPKNVEKINGMSITFDPKFKMTSNFTQTTDEIGLNNPVKPKELSELYFVICSPQCLKAITLRQASIFIRNHIINKAASIPNIQFLKNLSIDDQFIKNNQLQSALVNAKFLSGIENFTEPEQDHLLRLFLRTLKQSPKWRDNYENLTSAILRKKRVYYKKYFGSTLEKIVTRLKNEDVEGYNPDENDGLKAIEESESESDFESDGDSNEGLMEEAN